MRLWHQELIPRLDNKRLLGQHRECCALRGNGWGRKHSTVDYVFKYSYDYLFYYHMLVMQEMISRGYKPDTKWYSPSYHGKSCAEDTHPLVGKYTAVLNRETIFPEHNDTYMQECLENLRSKGVVI